MPRFSRPERVEPGPGRFEPDAGPLAGRHGGEGPPPAPGCVSQSVIEAEEVLLTEPMAGVDAGPALPLVPLSTGVVLPQMVVTLALEAGARGARRGPRPAPSEERLVLLVPKVDGRGAGPPVRDGGERSPRVRELATEYRAIVNEIASPVRADRLAARARSRARRTQWPSATVTSTSLSVCVFAFRGSRRSLTRHWRSCLAQSA